MAIDGSTAPDGAAPAAEARIIGVLNGGINGVPAFLRAALRAPPPEWTRGLLLPGLPCAPAVPMPDDFELEATDPFDEEEDDNAFAADAAALPEAPADNTEYSTPYVSDDGSADAAAEEGASRGESPRKKRPRDDDEPPPTAPPAPPRASTPTTAEERAASPAPAPAPSPGGFRVRAIPPPPASGLERVFS